MNILTFHLLFSGEYSNALNPNYSYIFGLPINTLKISIYIFQYISLGKYVSTMYNILCMLYTFYKDLNIHYGICLYFVKLCYIEFLNIFCISTLYYYQSSRSMYIIYSVNIYEFLGCLYYIYIYIYLLNLTSPYFSSKLLYFMQIRQFYCIPHKPILYTVLRAGITTWYFSHNFSNLVTLSSKYTSYYSSLSILIHISYYNLFIYSISYSI